MFARRMLLLTIVAVCAVNCAHHKGQTRKPYPKIEIKRSW